MPSEASLRRRIVQACILLATGLCAVYALLFLFGVGAVEDQLLNDRMVRAAGGLIRNHLQGTRGPVEGDPQVFQDAQIPAAMRDLGPGVHELAIDGRVLHVLVRNDHGHRFAVVDDESKFERIERAARAALVGAFLLCVVLALVLGATTATRVIRPLVDLSQAVQQDRLGDASPALSRTDEIGVLARALAAHHRQTQAFLAREQLFTGDVSHELRTPLTVMLGAAEVLTGRLAHDPELLPVAERIRRTALETGQRVSALLLLSRSPEGLEFPRVELAPLLEQEVERCRPLLAGKPVRLELCVEHAAHADGQPELMSIAFGNLIRNACHFTDAGFVRVTLQHDRVLVEDSGSGIPDPVRHQVFERFVRATENASGSGLGLAIVQRVCEHLGWTVRLDDSGAAGSRFVVQTLGGGVEPGAREATQQVEAASYIRGTTGRVV